jgi:hypothetical protein
MHVAGGRNRHGQGLLLSRGNCGKNAEGCEYGRSNSFANDLKSHDFLLITSAEWIGLKTPDEEAEDLKWRFGLFVASIIVTFSAKKRQQLFSLLNMPQYAVVPVFTAPREEIETCAQKPQLLVSQFARVAPHALPV